MKVAVVGTGYVGLVSGVCLAELGHEVRAVDLDAEKVNRINRGESPIHEPGLSDLLARNLASRFRATTSYAEALHGAAVSLIAVGTPFDGSRIDLTAVEQASLSIGGCLGRQTGYQVVVVKSTVVPGTTEGLVRQSLEKASGRTAGRDFGLGCNPEFLTEGQAVADFMNPDRIVIGGLDQRSRDTLEELYRGFPGVPLVSTNLRTAELIKYASNALLATSISFANEIADLCRALGGVDAMQVMKGVHLSNYLSPRAPDGSRVLAPLAAFLEPGCGFGGSCLPKDVKALVAQGKAMGEPVPLLGAVLEVNERRAQEVIGLIEHRFPSLSGLRVTVLGLAFKPDTDDVRESPGLRIAGLLAGRGARVTGYDPVARPGSNGGPALSLAPDLESAVAGAEVIVIATRWDDFRALPALLRGRSDQPLVVDGRRLLEPESVARYEGIGRKADP